jgi:hypothetical protein
MSGTGCVENIPSGTGKNMKTRFFGSKSGSKSVF